MACRCATHSESTTYGNQATQGPHTKSRRARVFWTEEPNNVVGKLTNDLLEYCPTISDEAPSDSLFEDCRRIAQRLLQRAAVDHIDAVTVESTAREFEVLSSRLTRSQNGAYDFPHTEVISTA